MSEPFLAEVRIFGFNFAPQGWAFCDGQILPINQNQSLYSLLGTIYGGDGRTSFALPDLRGRAPMHEGDNGPGPNHLLGRKGGAETVALTAAQIPSHGHEARATTTAPASTTQAGNLLSAADGTRFAVVPYGEGTNATPIAAGTVANAGLGQGHDNMQPYLGLSFCIALRGLFPS